MAELLDFQIDTMKFRLAVDNTAYSSTNTGRPYRRSTAQFRKDQVDNAATPGDNSLTGWWARGQFSFHEGSGIKYYDIDGSQDVLNRFQDSQGLDPWTPGELTYMEGPLSIQIPASPVDFAYSDWAGGAFVASGGNLYYCRAGFAPAQRTMTSGRADVKCVVAVGDSLYAGNGQYIECLADAYHDTATTVLWTNNNLGTADDHFIGLWYAKNRLWAVTEGGQWFSLPLDGGTIAAGDTSRLAWDSGVTGGQTKWSFTDTPGPVYISDRNKIYSISTDYQGAVPASTAPVVAVDLGVGRVIYAIGYCRGLLAIAEANEFLVGLIDTSGSVTVGPGVIKYDSTNCRDICSWEDRLYFTAFPDDGAMRLYEVNISTGSQPLQPGWQIRDKVPYDGNGSSYSWCVSGVNTFGEQTRLAVASNGSTTSLWYPSNKKNSAAPDTAYVTTGYHRFGTLDDKTFYSIDVYTQSAGNGYLKVERMDPDGTLTLIGFTKPGKNTFLVNSTDVAVALKFTFLAGSGTQPPILLGYQLKALPVPKRQRMIEVPLLMRDVFKTRTGVEQGRAGNGWDQLQALEALESSKAIVPYTDFRTGETGTAYIDGVEFYGDNLTSPGDRSFGGIAYVALRVIS